MENNQVLRLWSRFSRSAARRWLFGKFVCFQAPYFSSIAPTFETIRRGRVEVRMRKRRRVGNHIGTVHAIAMCNLAELAAGTLMEASLPASHRWIPKNMTVKYRKKAETDVRAVATLEPMAEFSAQPTEIRVPVDVLDEHGQTVLEASIGMWVSPRRAA